ncbi:MAG TPA: hypothetical protein VF680_14965 [Allosphingosinicella sp.]|jgi:hypothetical protein
MKHFRIAAAGALALLATACLLTPGKFDASLDLRRDGSFTYRYTGEVVFITPAAVAAAAKAEQEEAFKAEDQTCGGMMADEDLMSNTIMEERDCTDEEIAEKRREWEAYRLAQTENQKQEAERMKAMFGGLDPDDPKTVAQFTARLLSQDGWKRVTHKGKGVFDVVYEKSGKLDYDFVFPVFPDVDWIIPFVHATRRNDGRVRIVAPAFAQMQGMGGGMSPMSSLGGLAAAANDRGSPLPKAEGSFTLTTDAEILTNNTNDGAAAGMGGTKVLKWVVGPLDAKKPEALLKM